MKEKTDIMKNEDKLKEIITECVQDVLNENFKSNSISGIWDMYMAMCRWEKIDYDLKGYDEFKQALSVALDKLHNVIYYLKFGHGSPSLSLLNSLNKNK